MTRKKVQIRTWLDFSTKRPLDVCSASKRPRRHTQNLRLLEIPTREAAMKRKRNKRSDRSRQSPGLPRMGMPALPRSILGAVKDGWQLGGEYDRVETFGPVANGCHKRGSLEFYPPGVDASLPGAPHVVFPWSALCVFGRPRWSGWPARRPRVTD